MAKQAGPFYFTGTIDDVVFYKLGGNYYMRLKGEPTSGMRKRLKDPKHYPLLNLRKREFAQAGQLAKEVYRALPLKLRGHGVYGKLTGKAVRMLREGKSAETVKTLLLQELLPTEQPAPTEKAAAVEKEVVPKPAVSQPKQVRLSNWQVTVNGRLGKRVRNGYAQPKLAIKKQVAQPIQRFCAPCVYQQLKPPLC